MFYNAVIWKLISNSHSFLNVLEGSFVNPISKNLILPYKPSLFSQVKWGRLHQFIIKTINFTVVFFPVLLVL